MGSGRRRCSTERRLSRYLGAFRANIQYQRMVDQFVATLFGQFALTALDFRIKKLNNLAAFKTQHMIVMIFGRHFKDSVPAIEIVTHNQTGGFELSQHTVNRGKPYIFTGIQQRLVNVFCAQVQLFFFSRSFENLKDFKTRERYLQASLAQFMILVGHGLTFAVTLGIGYDQARQTIGKVEIKCKTRSGS
ncbi:Mu-like prophage protein gp37 [Zymobacter palmae]|uniref:Mu-like prophage protein gp37 n=1 Tax=Zymobacter palmae TaxID=33074 RepID=A0A348HBN2_9GAMM|nr:Mu-like prophage protein gp37 [Zymobacter palmae]